MQSAIHRFKDHGPNPFQPITILVASYCEYIYMYKMMAICQTKHGVPDLKMQYLNRLLTTDRTSRQHDFHSMLHTHVHVTPIHTYSDRIHHAFHSQSHVEVGIHTTLHKHNSTGFRYSSFIMYPF